MRIHGQSINDTLIGTDSLSDGLNKKTISLGKKINLTRGFIMIQQQYPREVSTHADSLIVTTGPPGISQWQQNPANPTAQHGDQISGPKGKTVSGGGALASDGKNYIYILKGNNTREVYQLNIPESSATLLDTIPNDTHGSGKGKGK